MGGGQVKNISKTHSILRNSDKYSGEKEYREEERKNSEVGSQLGMGAIREALIEEIIEQRSEGCEEESHVNIWGKNIPGRETSQCKGPKVRV